VLNPTPGLPEFDYVKPTTLAEAIQFLAQHAGEARPFMGGTDTFVRMRDGFWKEKYIVDVKNLDGMGEISFDPATGLTIGASVNMNRVIASPDVNEHYPVLAQAARTVASYQLRTRATIVGNICNASPAGDTIGPCIALDGVLHVQGPDGKRKESLKSFFQGPGKTTLKPGDIATAVTLPLPPDRYVAIYIKLGRNAIGDLAIVGVTALGYPDSDTASGYRFRVVLASVGPTPLVAGEAEQLLADNPITDQTISTAAEAAMAACTPIDDARGSARYRKFMIRNLTQKALTEVWGRLSNQ
jgi:carbon-monoxide dehydrogenase medium subunit